MVHPNAPHQPLPSPFCLLSMNLTALGTCVLESHSICPFVTDRFHLAGCPAYCNVAVSPSFLRLSNIPLYGQTALCSCCYPPVATRVASTLWLTVTNPAANISIFLEQYGKGGSLPIRSRCLKLQSGSLPPLRSRCLKLLCLCPWDCF
jgi:hypothetical protein